MLCVCGMLRLSLLIRLIRGFHVGGLFPCVLVLDYFLILIDFVLFFAFCIFLTGLTARRLLCLFGQVNFFELVFFAKDARLNVSGLALCNIEREVLVEALVGTGEVIHGLLGGTDAEIVWNREHS